MSETNPSPASIWARLQRRKVVQWGVAYAAAVWTLLQGIEYAVETFHWTDVIRQEVTLVAVLGFPIVVVIAWFHGDRGQQGITGTEIVVIALLLVGSCVVVWRYQPVGLSDHDDGAASDVTRVPPTGRASVAVLPFVALSPGEDTEYFADGVTEEVINALSTVPDLLVTARTSAFHFKGKNVPIPEIAGVLGVANVVEGSIRRSGDDTRITAQLVRASDGFRLWSESYDYVVEDDFAVQTRIAESVADALGILLDERKRAVMAATGVHDVRAFIAFQRGVRFFDLAHNAGPMLTMLGRANEQFDVAIARKPDFAEAYFYHADLYAHFLIDDVPRRGPDANLPGGVGVDAAARHLLADLDAAYLHERDVGQRRVIQAIRTTVTSDWRHLDEQIERAYAGWNNCRYGLWINQTAILFGYGELAFEHDLQRLRCDPLGGNWTRQALTAVWLGRPLDGLAFADRIEAQRGQDRDIIFARILALLALRRVDDAQALAAAGAMDAPEVGPWVQLLALQIPAAAGRLEAWAQLRPLVEHDPNRLLVGAAVFGDRDTANRTAGHIDSMMLGPLILLRVVDRCGCGRPFDLESTPNLARLLRDAALPWSPAAPIQFPLKAW